MIRKILLLLIAALVAYTGCGKDIPPEPSMNDTIFIQKDGLYSILFPGKWIITTDEEDMKNLTPHFKKNQTVDVVATKNYDEVFILVARDSDGYKKAELFLSGLTNAQQIKYMKSSLKMLIEGRQKNVKINGISDISLKNGKSAFILDSTLKTEKRRSIMFCAIAKKSVMIIKCEIDESNDSAENEFRSIVSSLDFSRKGVDEARKKIADFNVKLEEYNRLYAEMSRDGLFTGVWNGFALPFKFVFNFFKDKADEYDYISKSHTAVTYWIGFILGLFPGLGLFFGILRD